MDRQDGRHIPGEVLEMFLPYKAQTDSNYIVS